MQGPAISVELGDERRSRVLGGLLGYEAVSNSVSLDERAGPPASGGIAFGATIVKGQGPGLGPTLGTGPVFFAPAALRTFSYLKSNLTPLERERPLGAIPEE